MKAIDQLLKAMVCLVCGTMAIPSAVPAAAQSATAASPTLVLADGNSVAAITYDEAAGTPIRKAAELLSRDMMQLTGRTPTVAPVIGKGSGNGTIIGLASSPNIASLLAKNRISTEPIMGKWETYGRVVVPAPWNEKKKALVIFGSDVRGTIWGVIDLTREMGVSPWEWWADVKIRKVDRLTASSDLFYSKEPSVRYRGFFINAGGLAQWARTTYDPAEGGVGPKTYERVFELMWRLKANMLWPDMGGRNHFFNAHPENYELAKDYAIIRGSSHVEMLLRTNGPEWDPKVLGLYNWITNKQNMIEYWREAVEKYGHYDNLYSVGLRGADDFPMEGATTPEQTADIVSDAIAAQRKILSDVLHKPADQISQVFTPYKEIAAAYDTGRIKLPNDITINWSDDNFGYVMQFPTPAERKRAGGAGVNYHNVFWGAPNAYLLIDSIDPSLMWEEMTKAYKLGERQLWVLNVGSIKPCEVLLEFYLAMAFDIDAFAKPASVKAYLRNWAVRDFGADHGDEIANVMWKYYKLAFDRNPEFMSFTTTFPEMSVQQTQFNMLDFGDENARRAGAYESIMAAVDQLMNEMPEDRKSAFYQLVQFTVQIGGEINLRQLALDKSVTYGLQHRASANVYAEEAAKANEDIDSEVRYYNTEDGGKWNGFVTNYPQFLPNYLPPAIPTWKLPTDWSRCGVQVEGGGYFDDKGWWYPTLPTFNRELGAHSFYMDVFVEQPVDADWSATPNAPWIKVSLRSGKFYPSTNALEQRLHVSVDWTRAPEKGDGTLTVRCSAGQKPIDVHVRIASPLHDENVSFIDSQGVVSMYASHADTISNGWRVLDGVGHTGSDVQSDLDMQPLDSVDSATLVKAPQLTFRFATLPPDRDYSFPNYLIDEIATFRAMALPTFPVIRGGKLRIAVSLDRRVPQILDFSSVYYGAKWRQGVLNNTAVVELHDLSLKPGSHTLTVWALDPGVILDRFEIAFTGSAPHYGPVPESRISNE
jgi:Glycosyl hydrolase family 115/Gylcosyl hydrolase family 115 C-terminal domain